ncbi:MAG TPA: hypothetical protein VNK96_00715 [Fimbriimonadales bacterium]|nr:hypothetical protein [Fimbriimonadales bacterium]
MKSLLMMAVFLLMFSTTQQANGQLDSVVVNGKVVGVMTEEDVRLLVKINGGSTFLVRVAPTSYLRERNFVFKTNEKVTVEGFLVKNVIFAQRITTSQETIEVRDARGRGFWPGASKEEPAPPYWPSPWSDENTGWIMGIEEIRTWMQWNASDSYQYGNAMRVWGDGTIIQTSGGPILFGKTYQQPLLVLSPRIFTYYR